MKLPAQNGWRQDEMLVFETFLVFLPSPRTKYMKEENIVIKEGETFPSVFNHTSAIGDEMKVSYTVSRR